MRPWLIIWYPAFGMQRNLSYNRPPSPISCLMRYRWSGQRSAWTSHQLCIFCTLLHAVHMAVSHGNYLGASILQRLMILCPCIRYLSAADMTYSVSPLQVVCQPRCLCYHSSARGMALFATGDARHSGNDRWDRNSNNITECHAFQPPLTYVLCYELDLVILIRATATYIQYIYIVTLIKLVQGHEVGAGGLPVRLWKWHQ